MELKHKKILVLGYEKTGKAVAQFLTQKEADITIYDRKTHVTSFKYISQYNNEYFDLAVISPGVSIYSEIVQNLKRNGIKVISEIELAYLFCRGKIIAITGTNGKTTTVSIIASILETAKKRVFLCGNIGTPFISKINEIEKDDYVVVEVSSFQLEATNKFSPLIAGILNIKEDHLDRHKTFDIYKTEKLKIYQNMKSGLIVLNSELNSIPTPNIKKEFFSSDLEGEAFIRKNFLCYKSKKIIHISKLNLYGSKNYENILCAIIICKYLKIKTRFITRALKKFKPEKHRLQLVGVKKGIIFIDDSKATNVSSSIFAQSCFKNVILLLGGSYKGYEYDDAVQRDNIRHVVAFGEVRERVKEACIRQQKSVFQAVNLYQATTIAFQLATKGDVVLLSPASASFDEFSSYKERGDKFKEYVESL